MYTPDNIFQGGTYYDKYRVFWASSKLDFNFEKEQVDYCFRFVIESAIRLQQLDFEIEEHLRRFIPFL